MKISTSVLTVQDNIELVMKNLNDTTTDYLHLDVMDGKFVPNSTVRMMDEVLKYNHKPLDIHLMVEDVSYFIEYYKNKQPEYITFQVEGKEDISLLISQIKQHHIKVGLAINPDTDLEVLIPYLKELDLVLVMSVPAGYGGQSFVDTTLSRIAKLIKIRIEYQYQFKIEVDGGINSETIKQVNAADLVVSGSYIMNGIYNDRIEVLRKG